MSPIFSAGDNFPRLYQRLISFYAVCMYKPNHTNPFNERQANQLTRPLLRRLKQLQRCCWEECGCLTASVAILEKLDLIERLVEVIAMEINRRKQQP